MTKVANYKDWLATDIIGTRVQENLLSVLSKLPLDSYRCCSLVAYIHLEGKLSLNHG
jgi:hypothetical protein